MDDKTEELRHKHGLSELWLATRIDRGGQAWLIAFAAGSASAMDALGKDLAGLAEHSCVRAVDRLPRLADGRPDEKALFTLPIWPDADVEAMEADLASRSKCAVVILPDQIPPADHLVFPQNVTLRGAADNAQPAAGISAANERNVHGEPALLECPPLELGRFAGLTIAHVLIAAAERDGDVLTTVDVHGAERSFSYRDLLGEARKVAGGLRDRSVVAGDFILFQIADPYQYLRMFWGCQILGAVPAPLAPATSFDDGTPGFEALVHCIGLLDNPVIVADAPLHPELQSALARRCMEPRAVWEPGAIAGDPIATEAQRRSDDPAFVLFTSGSTGQPKAVKLHHAMVHHRSAGVVHSAGFSQDSCIMNWLPLDHVGGIVMCHISGVLAMAAQVQAATSHVSEDMLRWVRLMSRFGATFTWAPNFAYALLVDRADDIARLKPDLSGLRHALNGGEAVSAATGLDFNALVRPFGASAPVILPAWGMSETASVAIWDFGFAGRASTSDTRVCVGEPLPGMGVKIVRPDGCTANRGEIGKLMVRGPVTTLGYHGNDEATAEAFDEDGWFDTGDLAFIDGLGVTITGRQKDVIIVNGRNIASVEVEAVVDALDEVQTSYTGVAAIEAEAAGSEHLAVFFVPALGTDAGLRRALGAVREAVTNTIGLAPHTMIPLAPDQVPKTSIGKIQRPQLAKALADGAFAEESRRADRLAGGPRTVPSWFFGQSLEPIGRGDALARDFKIFGEGQMADALRAAPGPAPGASEAVGDVAVYAAGHDDLMTELLRLYSFLQRQATAGAEVVAILRHVDTDPVHAALLGVLKSAPQEIEGLSIRSIDSDDPSAVIEALRAPPDDRHIVLRHGSMFARRLQAWKPARDPRSALIRGGRYLVTGGLGDAGTSLVRALLHSGAGSVFVTGRRLEREPSVAAKLAPLRDLGGAVVYITADFSDPISAASAMASAVDGGLDAIFHLAGSYEERPLTDDQAGVLERMLTPKIGGLRAIELLLEERSAKRLVLFSSQIGTFGAPMASAYAAANAYLDAAANLWNEKGRCAVTSLGWSALAGTGLLSRLDGADSLGRLGLATITPAKMVGSLQLALASEPDSILVGIDPAGPIAAAHRGFSAGTARAVALAEGSPVDAAKLAESLRTAPPADRFGTTIDVDMDWLEAFPRKDDGSIDRERIIGGVDDARELTATERELSAIWCEVLSAGSVKPTDNFFSVGGNSMMAMRLVGRIKERFRADWSLRDIFVASTIAEQAQRLGDGHQHLAVLAQAEEHMASGPMPLTPAQQRLWFVHRLADAPQLLNISATMSFARGVDTERLARVLLEMAVRHAGLRVRCPMVDGRPVQEIIDPEAIDINLHTETLAAGETPHDAFTRDVRQPFNLEAGPLARFTLFVEASGAAHLSMVLHHIITDGVSVQLMFREIIAGLATGSLPAAEHTDYRRAVTAALAPPSPQRAKVEEDFWRQTLAGAGQGFELRPDHPRPAVLSHRGCLERRLLSDAASHSVRTLMDKLDISAFNVFLGLYSMVLARLSGEEDITVGTVVVRRSEVVQQNTLGFFVNLITLRSRIEPSATITDVMRATQRHTLEAFEHGDMPFEEVVSRLSPPQAPNRHPFFQVAFAMHDRAITESPSPDVTLGVMEPDLGAAQYDLHLTVRERGERFELFLEYAEALFEAETAGLVAEYVEEAALAAARNPDVMVSALPLMAAERRTRLLEDWGQGPRRGDSEGQTVLDRIAARAAERPDAPAVLGQARVLTFAGLEAETGKLAQALHAAGVRRGDRVLLARDRGAELIVGMIGIMKAGAAYVPVDTSYPEARIRRVTDEAGPTAIVAEASMAEVFTGFGVPILSGTGSDAGPLVRLEPPQPDDPAYVIFTSGSTGRPKGVVISHRNLHNLTHAEGALCGLDHATRTLQFSSPGFDASVWEIFPTLANGGAIVVAGRYELMPGAGLLGSIRSEGVTYLTAPPSVLRTLDPDDVPSLQVVVSAGEACPASIAARWSPGRRFINAYGPTETTVCATAFPVRAESAAEPPPIGRPLENMTVRVLNRDLELVPQGGVGELCVGGEGVAQGYLGREDLTAAAFITNPFGKGRLYRTGDLVRWRHDGMIEFIGRVDHQVKVRGVRIELGEVETLLASHADVEDAVALVEPGQQGDVLAVYFTILEGRSPRSVLSEVRELCRTRLPAAMNPSVFLPIERFAKTSSGKIDRASASMQPRLMAEEAAVMVPLVGLEGQIAKIWAEVLGRPDIDLEANFFDLGGHSLAMTAVHARLQQELGREMPLVTLFQHPTVASLARQLTGQAASTDRHDGEERRSAANARLGRLSQRRKRGVTKE